MKHNKTSKADRLQQALAPQNPLTVDVGIPSVAATGGPRRWLFRLLALTLVPLLLALIAETGLRLIDYGDPTGYFLNFKKDNQSVLIENQRYGRRFFPPALVRHPQPTLLSVEKRPNTIRIFVLGESAAMGDPEPAFGFSRALEVMLRERYTNINFEVVNTSITAINSHVIVPIAQDCAKRNGDIWIVYMGNNEVVGPYGAGTVFGAQVPSIGLIRLNIALKSLKIGQLANALLRLTAKNTSTPAVWAGMEMFLNQQVRLEDPKMKRVYENFRINLDDILKAGTKSGAKVLLCTLAANIKDCAPFASLHRPGMSEQDKAAWDLAYKEGNEMQVANNHDGAIAAYAKAEKNDNSYADLAFRQGTSLLALNRVEDARRYFEKALEEDALRFRSDKTIDHIIRESAQKLDGNGVFLADTAAAIAKESPHNLTGDGLLYEHVHFTPEGNYVMALALAGQVQKLLPENVQAQSGKQWMSMEETLKRLALTGWDRFQGVDTMYRRMQEPPFSLQSNFQTRQKSWRDQLEQLKPHTKPFAVKQSCELYRQELVRHPEDWVLHQGFARLLQSGGEDDAALEQWRIALKMLPHSSYANQAIGNLLDIKGNNAEAEAYFRQAILYRPEFPEALNGLGLCLVTQGKLQEAADSYRSAIALNREFAEGHVNLGLVLSKSGKIDDAIIHYREALKYKPDSASAHINLGKIFSSKGNLPEAINHYAEAVRIRPDDPIANYNLANALAAQGRRAEALGHYATAVQSNPDFTEARLNLGMELSRQGKKEDAMVQFSEAVRRNPNNVDARFNLAIACAQQKRWDEAIRQFSEVLRLDPGNAEAKKNLDAAIGLKKRSNL